MHAGCWHGLTAADGHRAVLQAGVGARRRRKLELLNKPKQIYLISFAAVWAVALMCKRKRACMITLQAVPQSFPKVL